VVNHRLQVRSGRISLVCRNFGHREVLCGRIEQSLKERVIVLELSANLNGGDDIGFDSAHQMDLSAKRRSDFLSNPHAESYPYRKKGSSKV
jgi:hypothetical protein